MSSYRQILYHIVFRTKDDKNQREHHKKMSFEDEYRKLLEEHGIKPDKRFFP